MVFPRILRNILPFQSLIYCSGQKLFLPFYHTVSDSELLHIKHLYKVKSIKEFEKEIDFMLKYFRPVTVLELTDSIRNQKPLKQNSFLLSFDDGLREMYDIVYPILKRKGIPAIIFLNSAFVDNKDLFFRYKVSLLFDALINSTSSILPLIEKEANQQFKSNSEVLSWLLSIQYLDRIKLDQLALIIGIDFKQYLEDQRPYLTSTQIIEMAESGFEFGSHSIDHPYFSELSLKEQLNQANESIKFVTEKFGKGHSYFSFPFFDNGVTRSFYNELFSDTNTHKPKLVFGSSGMKNDEFPYVLHRLSMDKPTTSGIDFIYSAYTKYIIKAILQKNCRKHPF